LRIEMVPSEALEVSGVATSSPANSKLETLTSTGTENDDEFIRLQVYFSSQSAQPNNLEFKCRKRTKFDKLLRIIANRLGVDRSLIQLSTGNNNVIDPKATLHSENIQDLTEIEVRI
jgi:hypothetical protein